MNITPEQAKKVLTGSYSFSMLGFSMLITRLKSTYSRNPTPDTLNKCASELSTFINKYSSVMASDVAVIAKV